MKEAAPPSAATGRASDEVSAIMSSTNTSCSTVVAQGMAVIRKNITEQRRQWIGHLLVLLSPFMFCGMMVGFQLLVNGAVDASGAFQCGCQCLECCYYSAGDDLAKDPPCYRHGGGRSVEDEELFVDGGGRGCLPSDVCLEHNTSNCGLAFSTSHQAFYCDIPHPTVWPPVIQLPEYRARSGEAASEEAIVNRRRDDDDDAVGAASGGVGGNFDEFDDAERARRTPAVSADDEHFAIFYACGGEGGFKESEECARLADHLLGSRGAAEAAAGITPREVEVLTRLLPPDSVLQSATAAGNSDGNITSSDALSEETMFQEGLLLLDEDPMLLARTQELTRPRFFLGTRASTLAAYYSEPAFAQQQQPQPSSRGPPAPQEDTNPSLSFTGSMLYGLSSSCGPSPAPATAGPSNRPEEASVAGRRSVLVADQVPQSDIVPGSTTNNINTSLSTLTTDLPAMEVLGPPGLLPGAGLSLLPPDLEIAMGAASERCFQTQLVAVESPADIYRALKCDIDGVVDDELEGCGAAAAETAPARPVAAFDFKDSRVDGKAAALDVVIWWNSSNTGAELDIMMDAMPGFGSSAGSDGAAANFAAVIPNQRIPGLMNMATNAFVKATLGEGHEILLLGTREMPKAATHAIQLDFNLLTGPLFFTWALQMLLPEMLRHIVQERESRSVDMMKMHGLRPATYWGVQFLWDFASHCRFLILFSSAGHISGLSIFTQNGYGLQATFYLLFSATQVAWASLVSRLFNRAKTASAAGNLWVILTGACAGFVMPYLLTTEGIGADVLVGVLQLLPPFALYSGLFELSQHSFVAGYAGTTGLTLWQMLAEPGNRMPSILLTFAVEVPVFLLLPAVLSVLQRTACHCLGWRRFGSGATTTGDPSDSQGDAAVGDDVRAEQKLSGTMLEASRAEEAQHGVVVHKLHKVYPGGLGVQPKVACKSLSLCLRHGECFGLLGPNGAGKTSALHMMVGLSKKTSGWMRVAGFDGETEMESIHHSIGVCLQHDCLWESLTAKEHLRFYCSLRHGMSRQELDVEAMKSLTAVDLQDHSERLVRGFSGGMKRRLSLAIALMGSPRVVYLDEPTTGIDPASRNIVWRAVLKAKLSCTMILTTHSMEEAQTLCDRLGIFVAGRLKCIGTAAELKRRFANHVVLTVMVATTTEEASKTHAAIDMFLRERFPEAELCFALGGTCKLRLPAGVAVSQLFKAVRSLRSVMQVLDWGINGATLEEVFINVAGTKTAPEDGTARPAEGSEAALELTLTGAARLDATIDPEEPLPVSQGASGVAEEPKSFATYDQV